MAVSKELLKELSELSVPEICDGMGLYAAMDYEIKPMVTKKKIIGPAFTVDVPAGEGGIIADALREVPEGAVIVIGGHGHCKSSYWGDHRSICGKFMKAEGVVIDGAFRDVEACEEVGFPIYARAISPGTALKSGMGAINVPISCGGVGVKPGDIIIGDRNGVVVLPSEEEILKGIVEKAERKKENQAWTIREMLRSGICQPKVLEKPADWKGEENDRD